MSRVVYNPILVLIAALLLAPVCLAQTGSELGMVDSLGMVNDVIVGHNNRGPYTLSWTNFDTDGISVIINGRTLRRGADYNIDTAGGVISFTSVVANDAMVRVSYRTLPGKSKRATGGSSIPVTLNLRSSASGNLRITGLYTQDKPGNPEASKSILGLGGDKSWGTSKLNSMFLVSQRNEGGSSDGSMWDRAAAKLGGATSLGMFKFTGSYQHSGESFEGDKEYKTGVGKEIVDFGTAFAPTKALQASASFNSSEDTAGQNKGSRSVTNQQSLVYAPASSTKLSLAHSTIDLTSPSGSKDLITTNAVQLSSTAIKRVTLRSAMTQRASDLLGYEQAFSAGVTAKPIDQVGIDVGYGTLDNKVVGAQTSTDVKVTATPIKQLAVQAGYSGVDSTNLGQSTKTSVAVQATPMKNLQLQGSAADSVDANANEQFQRNVSLSSTPFRFAKVTALLSQKGINSMDDVTKGAELQLTPGKRSRLSAGYRYAEAGQRVLTIYDYLAETKPWDFLSLSGKYRQRDLRATDAVNSAAVSMSLAPAKAFALTGEYQANPEDKEGAVQNFNSASLGLTTHIGSVGLETNFFQKTEYLNERISDERRFGLAVPVFGHGQLTTGCRLGRTLGNSELGTRTYLLGYRHSIGSDFSLALTGSYTQYLQDKMVQPEKAEVSTEVSLGAKF